MITELLSYDLANVSSLTTSLVNNWIGPIFLLVVAGISLKFVFAREFRQLGIFLIIAAVVGMLVFNAGTLFGKDGVLKKAILTLTELIK